MQTRSRQMILRTAAVAALTAAAWSVQAAPMNTSAGQPMGVSTTVAQAQRVQMGQTQDDVRSQLGRPAREQQFSGTNTTVWRYETPSSTDASEVLVEFNKGGEVTAITTVPVESN